ncbi:MAG TPA: diaminopimelate epimerase, partial [Candidatus Methylacidiphilales bacterium]|nr:diaminopimelate epimerase [Candidatus Methylacidiphilales bacterium]
MHPGPKALTYIRMDNRLPFVKMTGAGNDFVVIDNRALRYALSAAQVGRLCDRRFGIGADGVLAVEPADGLEADFRMRYYNADGGEAEMCGNGARCFARFVQPMPRAQADRVCFLTPAGLIVGEYLGADVRVNLTAPMEIRLGQRANFGWGEIEYHFMNTGVPHVVIYVPDVEKMEIVEQGGAIRRSPIFPRGTNVNFTQVVDSEKLIVRTYERGVEDETLACGTGVTAAALLTHLVHDLPLPLSVRVRGGDILTVGAVPEAEGFRDVTLTGP